MTIERLGGLNPLENINKSQKPAVKATVQSTGDSIQISDEAREMAEVYYLQEIARETPDIRADLVEQVKEKLKDPQYLNAAVIESTANKIMESFGL